MLADLAVCLLEGSSSSSFGLGVGFRSLPIVIVGDVISACGNKRVWTNESQNAIMEGRESDVLEEDQSLVCSAPVRRGRQIQGLEGRRNIFYHL